MSARIVFEDPGPRVPTRQAAVEPSTPRLGPVAARQHADDADLLTGPNTISSIPSTSPFPR